MKKLLSIAAILALTAGIAGCGQKDAAQGQPSSDAAQPAQANEEMTLEETQSNKPAAQQGTVRVAASPTPHAELLKEAEAELSAAGWDLEVVEFEDYIQPNNVVEGGEFDANFFQHEPYLNDFNQEHGTKLVSAAGIHYEPLGIYPGVSKSLEEIPEGAEIAVPNDPTNEGRALLLLQENGILTLKEGAGLKATKKDIAENPHNVEIVELEAAQVSRIMGEADFVVLNGNYAMQAGLSVNRDALAYEEADSEAAGTYVNVLAVKEGNESSPAVQALVKALTSEHMRDYINEKYDGAVVPVF